MSTRIVIVSDTHCREWEEVSSSIRCAVSEADIAIHCGDFTHMNVLEGFVNQSNQCIVVHGNSDPPDLRQAIPYVETVEIEKVHIGVTHPAWGGPPFDVEELLNDFAHPMDVIVFGHVHETLDEVYQGTRFVNPGQGYASFMVPATIAVMEINNGAVSVEIREVEIY